MLSGEELGDGPAPRLALSEDGTVGVDPDMIGRFFLQDCDDVTTEHALSRLTRQALTPRVGQIAWQQKPATYIVCHAELAATAEAQRRRVGAGAHLLEFVAGHHPFLRRAGE